MMVLKREMKTIKAYVFDVFRTEIEPTSIKSVDIMPPISGSILFLLFTINVTKTRRDREEWTIQIQGRIQGGAHSARAPTLKLEKIWFFFA